MKSLRLKNFSRAAEAASKTIGSNQGRNALRDHIRAHERHQAAEDKRQMPAIAGKPARQPDAGEIRPPNRRR